MIAAARLERPDRLLPPALVAGVCALAGAAAAVRPALAPLVAGGVVLALLSLQWRRGVWVLLACMPFAGVPVFVAGEAGLALRDAAIVLPLYAAFVYAFARDGRVIKLPRLGLALPALALLAALVLAGLLRAPSPSVGVIGARVWLAYVPLIAVGYHFVRGRADLDAALRVTALLGLLPAVIAVGEWLEMARTGGFGAFAFLYGNADVTPVQFIFGSGARYVMIARIPSTFTSSTSYYGFSIVAFAAALAMLLRHGGRGWALAALLLAAGAAASGNRAAYVAVPAITAGALLLAGPRVAHAVAALAAGAALAALVWLSGADVLLVASLIPGHVQVTLAHAWGELRSSISPFGHGTGWDTNAALRYGATVQARYIENWFAKAALEFGVPGLVAVTALMAALSAALLGALRRMDAPDRRLAAPVVALLLLTVVTLFKGPMIDFDPMNVYFWLLAGMVLALVPRAAGSSSPATVHAAAFPAVASRRAPGSARRPLATAPVAPARRRVRVAHLVSHPIPYFTPLYRDLARRDAIDLTVYYYSDATVRTYRDAEFGRAVAWDAPLLEGYRSRILRSASGADIARSLRRPHWDIVRAVAASRYDVVWVHGYAHLATWLAVAAARLRGARVLVRDEQTLLHTRAPHRRLVRELALRALYGQASALAIGVRNRAHVRRYGAPERRIFAAPYCVDNDALRRRAAELAPRRADLRARFGITDDAPVVLFAGKLIEKKQPLLAIEAFARVRARRPAWLLVAGDGPLRARAEALVRRLGVPNVRFAGFLNQSEMPEAYAAADVFVLPSRLHETWGLVVNEAMNFGLPVVVSDRVGCAADLVRPGENGFVVPHDSAGALARAIDALAADPAMRAAWGARGREIVARYSIAAAADGIVAACLAEEG